MMIASLSRISNNGKEGQTPLRDSVVEGLFFVPPAVGEPFKFFAPAKDPKAAIRLIETSVVVSISYDGDNRTIKTQNSTYRLEIKP